MIDTVILLLCVLAAMGAECIPLLLSLIAAAGVLTVWKEIRNRPGATNTRTVKAKHKSYQTTCFAPDFTGNREVLQDGFYEYSVESCSNENRGKPFYQTAK